jgi:selenium metabolism protein YedF
MKTIDCRGQACPRPVVATKKGLESSMDPEIWVLVDTLAAKENVKRFAESQGHRVEIAEEKGIFTLKIQKGAPGEKDTQPAIQPVAEEAAALIFIDGEGMGRGSEELGKILMRSFLHTLREAEVRAEKVIFVNSGVKLACEGSPALEDLQGVAQKGAEILSCGTCLDYFQLKEKLRVGRISNMYEILNSLARAGKVVKI